MRLVPLHSEQDTLWAALCMRLHDSESQASILALKERLMLYFASLVFGGDPFATLATFERGARFLIPQRVQHPAIQQWMEYLHIKDKVPRNVEQCKVDYLKREALAYIAGNSKLGHCLGRHTLLQLFASLYNYNVVLTENARNGPFGEENVEFTPSGDGKRTHFSVHITYNGARFELWREPREPPIWLLKGTTTEGTNDALYKLVRCHRDKVEPVGYFKRVGRITHYCITGEGCGTGIYRVLPANVSEFTIKVPLHVYTSRGLEHNDPYKCVGYTDQEGSPLAFLVNPSETRLIILVATHDESLARQALAEEMKLY